MIHGKTPTRRAVKCRLKQLHWKTVFDQMIDTLLEAEMIVQVHDKAGPFLSEAFLVPKPKDPTGPPRTVVDYSGLNHCFQRFPFN